MKKQKVRTPILSVFRDKPRNDEANCIEYVNDNPTINVCEDQLSFKDQIAFIDSCASNAMAILRVPSGDASAECNRYRLVDKHLNSAALNGTPIRVFATGDIGDWKNILFSSNVSRNLISSKRLNNMGYSVNLFDGIQVINSFNKEVVLRNTEEFNGMPYLPLKDLLALPNIRKEMSVSNISDKNPLMSALNLLHERCGHYNEGTLVEGHKRALIEGTGLKREDLVKRKGGGRTFVQFVLEPKSHDTAFQAEHHTANW